MKPVAGAPPDDLRTDAADPAAPPPVLLPYQQRWIDDAAQLKVAEKSRRIGLTWAEAADNVLTAAAAEDGANVFYISATQDMAREYVEACAMWARAFSAFSSEITEGWFADEGRDGIARSIKTYEVRFPESGRRILALSSRPANLRGKQGVIVIDEAAFAPDLAGLLKAAMAMLMWGDRVRIISTHDGADNAFAGLIDEVRAGKRGRATVHTIRFADAVADGLYRRVCLRRGRAWSQTAEDAWVAETRAFYGDDAAEELDVVPSASGGKYLPLALIAQRMVPAWPIAADGPAIVRGAWDDAFAWLPEHVRVDAIRSWIAEQLAPHLERLSKLRRHVFGGDFARSMDLSVFTVLAEEQDLTHRVRLVVELRNCPFSAQRQILFAIVDALRHCRFGGGALDATGNGAELAEAAAQRYGTEMVEQVKLSTRWYAENMPKLKAGLQDGTLTDIPRDDALRDDLRAITVVDGVPLIPRQASGGAGGRATAADAGGGAKHGRRHGDFAVSLLMGEYAFHREAGEIAWHPAPRTSGWDVDEDEFDDDDVDTVLEVTGIRYAAAGW